jgi:hypothetical protein
MKFGFNIECLRKGVSKIIEESIYGLDVKIEYAIPNNDWYILYANDPSDQEFIIKKFMTIIGGKVTYQDIIFSVTFGVFYDKEEGCIPVIFDQDCNYGDYYIFEDVHFKSYDYKFTFNLAEREQNNKLRGKQFDIESIVNEIKKHNI